MSRHKITAHGRWWPRIVSVLKIPGAKIKKARSNLIRIPFFGFLNVVFEIMGHDGVSQMASSIAYYAILSLFPLLLGVISVLGYLLPSTDVQNRVINYIEANLPSAADLIKQNIAGIIQARGPLGIISILGLFWTAGALFGAINRSVNRAYSVTHIRPFYLSELRNILMSLSSCIFFFIAITATTFTSLIKFGIGALASSGLQLLEFLLLFLVLTLIYKAVPNTKTYWRHVWTGGLAAAIAFEIARVLLSVYFSRFSNVKLVYGSIASIIILLIFDYYATFILILGAEISSEYGRRQLGSAPRPRFPPDMCELPRKR